MTPSTLADALVASLNPPSTATVLDPAVGTGELLLAVKRFVDADVIGFDVDPVMVKAASANVPSSTVEVVDLFGGGWRSLEGEFDYIVANPPYFEVRKDDERLLALPDFETAKGRGRVNIFSLFVEYGLRLLSPTGKMSFLVPPSMNNGAYFSTLRDVIVESGVIEDLTIFRENDRFENALTSAQIITIQKTDSGFAKNFEESKDFITGDPTRFSFTDDAVWFDNFCAGKTTLSALGFCVRTGPTVWNQHVNDFVGDDEVDAIPLIYAADIADGVISFSPKIAPGRRRLRAGVGRTVPAPFIAVNRVVGSLSSPSIKFALVEDGDFFVENHVNVITHEDPEMVRGLITDLSSVDASDMSRYLKSVTGNTQLSATELSRMPVRSTR